MGLNIESYLNYILNGNAVVLESGMQWELVDDYNK